MSFTTAKPFARRGVVQTDGEGVDYCLVRSNWRRHHPKRRFDNKNNYNLSSKMLSPREQFLQIHGSGNKNLNGYSEDEHYDGDNDQRINGNYINKPRFQRIQPFGRDSAGNRGYKRFDFDGRRHLKRPAGDRYIYQRYYDPNKFSYIRKHHSQMSSKERTSSYLSHDRKILKREQVEKEHADSDVVNDATKDDVGNKKDLSITFDFDLISDTESTFDDDFSSVKEKDVSISPIPSCKSFSSSCNNDGEEKNHTSSDEGSDQDCIPHFNVILEKDCNVVLSDVKNEQMEWNDEQTCESSPLTNQCQTERSIKHGCGIRTKKNTIINEGEESSSGCSIENECEESNTNAQYDEHTVMQDVHCPEESVKTEISKAVVQNSDHERILEKTYSAKAAASRAADHPLKLANEELDNGYESVESEVFSFPLTSRHRTVLRLDKFREPQSEKEQSNTHNNKQPSRVLSPNNDVGKSHKQPINNGYSESKAETLNGTERKKSLNTNSSTSSKSIPNENDNKECVTKPISPAATTYPDNCDHISTLQTPSITDISSQQQKTVKRLLSEEEKLNIRETFANDAKSITNTIKIVISKRPELYDILTDVCKEILTEMSTSIKGI